MRSYLRNNNSENLIIFFCGWGMDENPFSLLKSSSDILFVYDYTTTDFEYDFSKYKSIKLLAFSYGVYASGIAKLPKVDKSVAINGTLVAVDDDYGVPTKKFELSENMNSETVVKFRQRLFAGEKAKEHFDIFENHLPNRSAQSCTDELLGMKSYFAKYPVLKRDFDEVYVGILDKVVPTKNQLNFWNKQNHQNIIKIETGHFPFYNFESFDEIL